MKSQTVTKQTFATETKAWSMWMFKLFTNMDKAKQKIYYLWPKRATATRQSEKDNHRTAIKIMTMIN